MTKAILPRIGGIAAAIALTVSMAACAGGQSVADACKLVKTTDSKISESNSDIANSMSKLTEGEKVDFAAALDPVSKALKDTQSKITNDKVKPQYDKMVAGFESVKKSLAGIDMSVFAGLADLKNLDMSDPASMQKIEELRKKSEAAQAEFSKVQKDLEASQKDMTGAVSEINKVCNAG
ncbi:MULTISPECIES: hypothetical protein [unclassified Leucobacter]|uniref:hypothetical protein n=1 Tax=unclassified Leucobacter TaxID=2621730 RepID=UPI000621BD14|nr:hypothetical protein [Leucobacter sp. Ag1]KKI20906.1 hypothetical protein XM48_06610 [Leucobacter sp. Ag1]